MGNLDELVGAMKGQDTLSGWDVLVSYNEVQLNALLAERARTLNLTLPDPWETPYEDLVTGAEYTMVFDVKLLQPTLQFVDTTNSITLIMGLAGQYHVKDNTKMTDLPSGLTCELSTSLVNVAGEWHEEGWTPTLPKEGQQETPGDNFVVILEPGDSKARGICVDLKNCVATLSEAPGANIPEGTKAMLSPLIAPFLRGHFAKHSYRLCLAALSNHFDVGEKDSELLQPEHFCFTVESGALLTWIGLKGGPNTGTRPSGKTSLSFSPGSSARSPIPDDSTASIIFSHNTMANLFLGHALSQSPDIKGVTCTSIRTNTGMNFSVDFTSHAVVIPPEDWSSGTGSGYHVDGCNIDLNENSCGLKIDGDARPGTTSQKPFSLSWSSNTKLIRSNSYQPSPMPGKPGPRQSSSCHATFMYAGSGQWKGSTDPVNHPNQLGVQFALEKYLSMNIVPDEPNWWDTYNGKTGDVPRKYQNLTPTAPSVNLSLKPLDYFLTTNLLLPGQHIFIADDPVQVSTGTQKGLATPRDTVLTGNVAVNTPASTRRVDAMRRHRELLGTAAGSQSFSPSAAESTAATLNDIKEAFLAFPSNNLLGDLLKNTLGGGGKLPARDLLQQYGFGHLADENFLSLWGTSIEELLGTAPETATAAARSMPTPTQIDMRLYSGYYIISQPEDDSGEQFLIHPLTGAIRMRNKDVVPKQTYDTEARRVMVTWQSPGTGATYSAFFSLCVDQDTLALGTKCKGTVARSGDQSDPQPFEAFLRGYRPAPTWLNDSAASSLRPLEEGRDPAENANLYLGMIVAGISIVGNIVSIAVLCWKTAKSKKEMAFKDKTINEQKEAIDKMADSIQAAVAKSVRQEYDNHAAARDLALENLEKLVDAAAKAELDKILKPDPQALERPNRQDHIDKLHQVAKQTLVEEAPSALDGVTKLAIEAAMARNSFRNALPDGRPEKMLKDLQVQEVQRAVKWLEDVPTPDSKAFSELSAQKVADVARAEAARLKLVDLSKIRADAEKTLKIEDAATKKFEKEVVEEAKKKAEDPKATDAEKQAYKEAQDKLKDLKNRRDAEQKKHNDAKENEKKADKHREEREREEHKSKERQEKKREHVL